MKIFSDVETKWFALQLTPPCHGCARKQTGDGTQKQMLQTELLLVQ